MKTVRPWRAALARLAGGLMLATTVRAQAPAAPAGVEAAETPRFVEAGGVRYHDVNFYRLSSFKYPIVDASTGATAEQIAAERQRDKIPGWIRFYHGKPVALTGYVLPITLEQGRATKFILMRDTNTCCYGNVPNINEFVIVTMKGKGARFVQDVPTTVLGTFQIVERYEENYLMPIFEMEGDRLAE